MKNKNKIKINKVDRRKKNIYFHGFSLIMYVFIMKVICFVIKSTFGLILNENENVIDAWKDN